MEQDREQAFLQAVGGLLDADVARALCVLRKHYTNKQLCELAHSPDPQVALAAVRCLGLVGQMSECQTLVLLLALAAPDITTAIEDALWSIWMRAGSDRSRARLAEVIAGNGAAGTATIDALAAIIAEEPDYAEARHQLAMALHEMGRFEAAETAYAATLDHNPWHYAAAAGLGHVRVEQGDFPGALEAYRLALRIHPGLGELADLVPQLEAALHRRDVA